MPQSDEDVLREMDVVAVESTRSYRRWSALPDGAAFSYNQKYTRGRDGHDWLLRKNIWRRMRYRRENRAKVARLRIGGEGGEGEEDRGATSSSTTTTAGSGNDAEEEGGRIEDGTRRREEEEGEANDEDDEDDEDGEDGEDGDDVALVVSRAMEDAAAGAMAGDHPSGFFAHHGMIDADAVAALGAGGGEEEYDASSAAEEDDDPDGAGAGVVPSCAALDAAARLAAAVSAADGGAAPRPTGGGGDAGDGAVEDGIDDSEPTDAGVPRADDVNDGNDNEDVRTSEVFAV